VDTFYARVKAIHELHEGADRLISHADLAAKNYVVSSTLDQVDWIAELVRGDLAMAVQQLKQESGKGLLTGGVTLPLALAELGLIDEYEFVGAPKARGPWAVVRGPIETCRLETRQPRGVPLGSGGDAL
jgi:hypothetical protein